MGNIYPICKFDSVIPLLRICLQIYLCKHAFLYKLFFTILSVIAKNENKQNIHQQRADIHWLFIPLHVGSYSKYSETTPNSLKQERGIIWLLFLRIMLIWVMDTQVSFQFSSLQSLSRVQLFATT